MGSGSLAERATANGWCTLDEWHDAAGNTGGVASRNPELAGRRTYAADGSVATGERGLTMPRLLDLLDGYRERRRTDLLSLGSVVAVAFSAPDKLEALFTDAVDPVDDVNRSYRFWDAGEGVEQPE